MVISYNFIYDRYFSYYYLTELESWGSDREPLWKKLVVLYTCC